jgi:Raf kinase inhibitor-like YbhB/YbcL family protein
MALTISSAAFNNGETIPKRHTCDGENRSPALRWNEVPGDTQSLALILEDVDAPFGVFYHWVLYNLPAALKDLPDGQPKNPRLPQIGMQGPNSFRRIGYDGPCPPPGKPHRYYFHLYALDLPANLPDGLNAEKLKKSMAGHILEQTEWMGIYKK